VICSLLWVQPMSDSEHSARGLRVLRRLPELGAPTRGADLARTADLTADALVDTCVDCVACVHGIDPGVARTRTSHGTVRYE